MKLHHKIFGIGLVTAVIVPHLSDKGYISIIPDSFFLPAQLRRRAFFLLLIALDLLK
jgi:hypothetical protein